MWITRGMFVPHIPPVTHTNPPPAHTTPGKVQGYSDSFSITEFFQKTRWETRIDPFLLVNDTVDEVNENSIRYNLTDGLTKFFDLGVEVSTINSAKKIAKEGDFSISRLRSYLEEMGIVECREKPQIFSTEFLIFREKTNELSAHTLFALCMTKTVQTILKRGQYGTGHPRFYDFLLTKLPVPDCLLFVDAYIKKTIQQALKVRSISRDGYTQAQTMLLAELGLINWQPKHQLTFVKNYSDTKQADRIDAEYFQPKYEEIVKAIKGYAGGWDTLGNLVSVKKCVEVGSGEYLDEGIPFVRVSNLNPFDVTGEKYISENLYEKIKQHQPKQGEILFSKDATPGIAHYLRDKPQKMIPSSGILRLKNKTEKINNEYLTLVLNSMLTKEQINRDVGGSVILHWRPEQVKETAIPILPLEKQTQIQQKITESFALRKQSKHLLECAKQSVEIAIEQDEKIAISWLEKQMNSTGRFDSS